MQEWYYEAALKLADRQGRFSLKGVAESLGMNESDALPHAEALQAQGKILIPYGPQGQLTGDWKLQLEALKERKSQAKLLRKTNSANRKGMHQTPAPAAATAAANKPAAAVAPAAAAKRTPAKPARAAAPKIKPTVKKK